jgi:hypothetical protein
VAPGIPTSAGSGQKYRGRSVAKLEGFGDNLVTVRAKMQQSNPKVSPIIPLKAVAIYT